LLFCDFQTIFCMTNDALVNQAHFYETRDPHCSIVIEGKKIKLTF
jgi:hypothetical protein